MNKKFLLLILLFLAIGFTLYSPGMQAPRYCDDFTVVPEGNLSTDLYKTWTSVYQRDMFYRPIEDTITILIIYFFGWDTTLVHILTLLIHLYLVSFIYYVILKLGYSSTTAFCGAFFVLIAQVNVFAVGSNDTISSTLCCCFFLTSLWVLYLAVYNNENIFKPRLYSISLILFVLALFTKEAAVTFFPIFALLALVKDPFFRSMNFSNFKRLLFISIPFLVIFVLYYLFHSSIAKVHPSTGSESYNFRFGLNLIINIAQMLFVIFLPLSSVRVFEAVQIKDFKFLALAAGLTALFAFIIFYGIWKSKKIKEGIILLAFMLAAFFPYVLMNHVNEHYTYYSMLFVAMIVGLGASYFINKLKGTPRTISILFFTIIVLLNCFSIVEKSYQMKETGENADRLFSQISGYLPQVQHGGALVLVNPAEKQLKYSVFRLPGFETIRYAQFYVYKLAGRSDFEVNIIEWNEIEQNKKPNALMLKLEGDKVVPLK